MLTLLTPLLLLSAVDPYPADALLDRVTVYPGQALVERVVTIEADAPGPMVLEVGPFPVGARRDSFQVRLEAGEGKVQGIQVSEKSGDRIGNPEREARHRELLALRADRRAVETELASLNAGEKFLESLWEGVSGDSSGEALLQLDNFDRIEAIYGFVMEKWGELDRRRAAHETTGASLDQQIAELELQLTQAERSPRRRYLQATVPLFCERPGTLSVRVVYLVQNCGWGPTYDVRVATDLTGVSVSLVAQVWQKTGEDWTDAELLLSTATPSVGLDPPSVPVWYFDLARYRGPGDSVPPAEEGFVGGRRMKSLGYAGAALELVEAEADSAYMEAPEVSVEDLGITAQFRLPGKETVASSGEPTRFAIREVPLDVRPERYVVPSLSERAFLRAEVTLAGDAPLLAGPAKVFLGPDFLGEAHFSTLRPGDTALVNLGIDPHLSIETEVIEDVRDDPGFLSSTVTISRRYRAILKLSSSASGAIEVLIEEPLPISRVEPIEVSYEGLNPAPLSDEESAQLLAETGLHRWRLQLVPGQSARIHYGYDLSFPEDVEPLLYSDL